MTGRLAADPGSWSATPGAPPSCPATGSAPAALVLALLVLVLLAAGAGPAAALLAAAGTAFAPAAG